LFHTKEIGEQGLICCANTDEFFLSSINVIQLLSAEKHRTSAYSITRQVLSKRGIPISLDRKPNLAARDIANSCTASKTVQPRRFKSNSELDRQ
jgi:hypothetical protein